MWRVVQVAHRRLDIRVPHPLLDTPNVGRGDYPRPECVAQIVNRSDRSPAAVNVALYRRRNADPSTQRQ